MEKLLIITDNYPPQNNGGVARIVAFENFFLSKGWDVEILTQGKEFIRRVESNTSRVISPNRLSTTHPIRVLLFVIAKTLAMLQVHIDYNYVWLALCKVLYSKNRTGFTMVLCSYPGYECLKLGIYLQKKWNIKLISDFRDPLIFETAEFRISQDFPRKFEKLRLLELELLKSSQITLSIAPSLSKYLSDIAPMGNVLTVSNGYDMEIIDYRFDDESHVVLKNFSKSRVNVLYTGTLTHFDPSRDASGFLKELKERDCNESDICVHVIGKHNMRDYQDFGTLISNGVLKLYSEVDRITSIKLQRKADYLLLFTGLRTCVSTGKLFEYLISNRPIIAFTSGTFAEEIIESCGVGECFHPAKIDDVKTSVTKLLNGSIEYFPDSATIQKYSRNSQLNKLWRSLY